MKRFLSILIALAMMVSMTAVSFAEYADGTFTGSANGMGGELKVTVTVKDGKITEVVVGDHKETPGISDPAIEQIPLQIVEKNSTKVDAIASATITSDAIMQATENALNGVVAEKGELTINIQPDVIVVGAGMAGLSSAVRALELGANVLVLEQNYRVGGSANTAGGSISGTGYRAQKEAGIEDSPESLYNDFVQMGGGEQYMNTEIAHVYAERSGAAIDWLEDYVGVEMSDTVDGGGYNAMNTLRVTYTAGGPASGGGSYFINALNAKLDEFVKEGKAQLCLDTLVTELMMDENKDVLGVKVGDMEIPAKSVIVATGGYGYCERWLKEFNFTNITSNDPVTAIGSGYDFARAAGAAFDNMDYSSCYGGSVPVTGFQASLRCNVAYPGAIWVNNTGDRMFNEPVANTMDKRTVWRTADKNEVYVVLSEAMLKEEIPLFTGMMSNSAAFTTEEKINELIELGYMFKADTAEELGAKMGAANLGATIAKYNQDIKDGVKDAFGREKDLIAFEGPVYAVYTIPYLMMTAAGPRINGEGQLAREDGSLVGNVYLAGEIVGSANIAGHNTIGGIGHGLCATWGMISAESAVKNATK